MYLPNLFLWMRLISLGKTISEGILKCHSAARLLFLCHSSLRTLHVWFFYLSAVYSEDTHRLNAVDSRMRHEVFRAEEAEHETQRMSTVHQCRRLVCRIFNWCLAWPHVRRMSEDLEVLRVYRMYTGVATGIHAVAGTRRFWMHADFHISHLISFRTI